MAIVVAASLLAWAIGLPGPLVRREGTSSGEETLRLLLEVTPAPGARGFPGWRGLARLGAPDPRASGRIGFDGERLILHREDGPVRWTVGLLLDLSTGTPDPVALMIECQPADVRSPWRTRALRGDWPHPTQDAGWGWRARWRDPRRAAELEARAREVLGGHFAVDVPASLTDAYELLLDPLRAVDYAPAGDHPCGPEPGRVALERLLASGRDELVRNVLRGLDPEGRVYACEALLDRLVPDPEDRTAVSRLLELDVPVRLQAGTTCSAREALGPLASRATRLSR